MDERRGGPIGLFISRPELCLATAGSVLTLSSLVNLAVVIFADKGRWFYRPGLLGWSWSSWILVAGIFGFATGATMLIAAGYLRGLPTKSRLVGSVLIAFGILQCAVSLLLQAWGGLLPGILFLSIGVLLTARSPVNHPVPAQKNQGQRND